MSDIKIDDVRENALGKLAYHGSQVDLSQETKLYQAWLSQRSQILNDKEFIPPKGATIENHLHVKFGKLALSDAEQILDENLNFIDEDKRMQCANAYVAHLKLAS